MSMSYCHSGVLRISSWRVLLQVAAGCLATSGGLMVPAPGNEYATPLRYKLGGRPVLSARFNVETARSERKRPDI